MEKNEDASWEEAFAKMDLQGATTSRTLVLSSPRSQITFLVKVSVLGC